METVESKFCKGGQQAADKKARLGSKLKEQQNGDPKKT